MSLIFKKYSKYGKIVIGKEMANENSLDNYVDVDITQKFINELVSRNIPFLKTYHPNFLWFDGKKLVPSAPCISQKNENFKTAIEKFSKTSILAKIPVLFTCKTFKVFRYLTQQSEYVDEVIVRGSVIDKTYMNCLYECKNKKFKCPLEVVNYLNSNGCNIDLDDHVEISKIIEFIKTNDFTFFDPKNVFVDRWNKYLTTTIDSK